ncbi:MAG TPA: tryptophan synthase subunit beta, partial [Caulobacteraceae bacterium]|nr:tryptophan synthase subunit beta [Caulobacteraceae bacterium]
YLTCTDEEALEAFKLCAELEGIIPALESAHAIAKLPQVAKEVGRDGIVVLTLSGRGDKDIFTVAEALGRKI